MAIFHRFGKYITAVAQIVYSATLFAQTDLSDLRWSGDTKCFAFGSGTILFTSKSDSAYATIAAEYATLPRCATWDVDILVPTDAALTTTTRLNIGLISTDHNLHTTDSEAEALILTVYGSNGKNRVGLQRLRNGQRKMISSEDLCPTGKVRVVRDNYKISLWQYADTAQAYVRMFGTANDIAIWGKHIVIEVGYSREATPVGLGMSALSMSEEIPPEAVQPDDDEKEPSEERKPARPSEHRGKVVINEILATADPSQCDYVELRNISDEFFDLSGLRLGTVSSTGTSRSYFISENPWRLAPGDYVALTRDALEVADRHPRAPASRIVEMERMPNLAADGIVVLLDGDSATIDSVSYAAAWHHPNIADVKDIALERRSATINANVQSNWGSASAAHDFGTPGYANSIDETSHVTDSKRTYISLSSKIIEPEGGETRAPSRCHVSVTLPAAYGSATMRIFSTDGELMATPYNNVPIVQAEQRLTFDGRDDSGTRLPRGTYIIAIEAWTSNGSDERRLLTVTVL